MLKLLSLFLILVSCGNDDQKKYSQLDELRILAIQADFPEINAPQSVALTPYLSYPDGGDTNIAVNYTACLDPGVSLGADPTCEGLPAEQIITGSANYSTTSLGAATAYTGAMTPINFPVPLSAFAFLATQDPTIQFNGIDMIIFFNFTDTNKTSSSLQALKRIRLTSKSAGLNTNPTVSSGFLVDGNPLAAYPIEPADLSLAGVSLPENYELRTVTGEINPLTELMTISWFSNQGDFQFTRTEADGETEFLPEATTSGSFVAIYRDNRGGVTFVQANFP